LSENIRTNLFICGFQKCGSTWLNEILKQHPNVLVPNQKEIHFFDIHYAKGIEFYSQFFMNYSIQKIIVDNTTSYARDPLAPKRIYNYNPKSKIVFLIRNPIDRAFSHYWHEKRKLKINFKFEEFYLLNFNIDVLVPSIGMIAFLK